MSVILDLVACKHSNDDTDEVKQLKLKQLNQLKVFACCFLSHSVEFNPAYPDRGCGDQSDAVCGLVSVYFV